MTRSIRGITGYLLTAAAVIGLIFSLAGLTLTWIYKPVLARSLNSSLNLISGSLTTASQGMQLIKQSLQTLDSSVASVENTLQTASQSIEDTLPMMDTMGNLLDKELPASVGAVQTSLNSAYETAKIIDSVLTTLTFLNRDLYNPEVPLHTSLANISESLNSLPVSFASMAENIKNTNHNMQVIQVDVVLMQDAIRQVETSLNQYDQVITDYSQAVDQVQVEVTRLNARLTVTLTWMAIGLTVFLVWMAIAQLGLLIQGLDLINRRKESIGSSDHSETEKTADTKSPPP